MAEIRRTAEENKVPVGSAIIVNITGVEEIVSSVHSIRIVLFSRVRYRERGAINIKMSHMRLLACLCILNFTNMKKSVSHF